MGPCIPASETRTNLCSNAKIILKIETKLRKFESKITSQLENDHPLWVKKKLLNQKNSKCVRAKKQFLSKKLEKKFGSQKIFESGKKIMLKKKFRIRKKFGV